MPTAQQRQRQDHAHGEEAREIADKRIRLAEELDR